MSTIYDSTNGETICAGISARAALATAAREARDRGEPVILEDADGTWLVHADGLAEAHRDEDAEAHAASLGDDDDEDEIAEDARRRARLELGQYCARADGSPSSFVNWAYPRI